MGAGSPSAPLPPRVFEQRRTAGSGRYKTLIKGAAKAHRFANIAPGDNLLASSAAGVLMLLKATMVFTPRAVPPAPSPAPAAH